MATFLSHNLQDLPLLTTKLYIPLPRPEWVPRPRLIERLTSGLHRHLTLVCAPAGFGKTTLVAEWIQELKNHPNPVAPAPAFAWLSLDEDDNDPVRFFTYLIAALETALADCGADALALLQSPKPPPLKSVLTVLINNLAGVDSFPSPGSGQASSPAAACQVVLVLDDYHVIEDVSIHEGMAFLLEHMPPQMHLVIATRLDPPLPLARLRTRGHLVELRETDLRFTRDEAMAFLNQAMRMDLSSSDVAALEARTEGWAAGLQLAALSLGGKSREHISGFIAAFSGSHRHVIDYLADEVMAQQPRHIHDFLCQTAILNQLTAPLCDAVTEREDSDAILRQLEAAHLFLVPLDDQRKWYRYHRLFADFLLSHLQQDMPDQVTTLHRRAASWYQAHGLAARAVGHALEAGDFEQAASLIEEIVEAVMMRSEIATFHNWLEALPHDIVRAHPRLCVYHAWTLLLSGHPLEAAEASLQDAEKADATGSLAGEITMFRALIATYQGETQRSVELARQALDLLPERSPFLRSMVAGFLGVNYLWSGDIVTARRALEEASSISQKVGNLMNAVLALCHLAEVSIIEGQLHQAQALYQHAFELATDERGQPRPIAGLARIGLGSVLREWNALEAAEQQLVEGIELIQNWGAVGALSGYAHLARLKQAQGDPHAARQAIQKAAQIARDFDAMEVDDRLVDIYQAQLWIAQGDLEAVTRWVETRGLPEAASSAELVEWAGGARVPLFRVVEYMMLARVYIAQNRPGAALQVLEPLIQGAEAAGWTAFAIQSLGFQALALQAQGHAQQAMAALERALSLAEPGGFVRVFLDEGEPMVALLRQAASRGIFPVYLSKLLNAFEATAPGRAGAGAQPREAEGGVGSLARSPLFPGSSALVEPLSERELEVLRLMAAGLTNREIADELVIALSTVKTHINNIYRKLDVSRRTQAVARARELGLL
ncbi:MAG: LuxR C-terminal-related transcriptional regulator [Anaerolineae bacterium]